MAMTSSEKQAAYRDRKQHDAKRDADAELGARLVSAQINEARLGHGRYLGVASAEAKLQVGLDDTEARVARAIKHAAWLESEGLPAL